MLFIRAPTFVGYCLQLLSPSLLEAAESTLCLLPVSNKEMKFSIAKVTLDAQFLKNLQLLDLSLVDLNHSVTYKI